MVEELQPDLILISVPRSLFSKVIPNTGIELISFDKKKDGTNRKLTYRVDLHYLILKNGKQVKVVFGQSANKPFDTISINQKIEIGKKCLK